MKGILVMVLLCLVVVVSCAPTSQYTYPGAGAGAVLGGIAGALLDRHNPWRGGLIGAGIGGLFGGTVTELSARASREAAMNNHPVEYRTEDGRGIYRADPEGYNAETKCHKIHERVWEDGKLMKDEIKEVCEGTKYERKY